MNTSFDAMPRKKSGGSSQATTSTHCGEKTIIFPKDRFKKELGVEPETFSATESEDQYYSYLREERQGSEKYLFQDVVDKGGMGAIFRVQDQDLHRSVAMKVLLPKKKHDAKIIDEFVKEAKITGFLEHPNIIPVHEFGLLQETGIFFTMKLVQGETLRDILAQIKRRNSDYLEKYTPYALLTIFRKVCDAVAYAHSMGILHLDIKPHNVIVGQYGEVFLIDWGIAKVIEDAKEGHNTDKQDFFASMAAGETPSKHTIRVQGSPSFMSPEQARGETYALDQRSDIFLLGSTLYTIFTLQLPYTGRTTREILEKARIRNLISPHRRSPDQQIPEEICRVILKAMAYYPAYRYQTVEELAEDIDLLIAGRWMPQNIKVFKSGEILVQEGAIGEEAYIILRGLVQITKNMSGKHVVLRTCKEGDIIGEMSLISNEPRTATVEALEETTTAVLTKHIISDHLKKLPPYMEKIVSELTARLQQTDTMIHPHLTVDCTPVILKQLRLIFKDKSNEPQDLRLPFHVVVAEISQDLGIPDQMVRTVLLKAIEQHLISQEEEMLQIPDMRKLESR